MPPDGSGCLQSVIRYSGRSGWAAISEAETRSFRRTVPCQYDDRPGAFGQGAERGSISLLVVLQLNRTW